MVMNGIVLYYCFLQHFEGTTTEDIIKATLLLVPDKMQLDLFDGNVTSNTTSIRRPVRKLQKSNHEISLHIYIHTFMDAPTAPMMNLRPTSIWFMQNGAAADLLRLGPSWSS